MILPLAIPWKNMSLTVVRWKDTVIGNATKRIPQNIRFYWSMWPDKDRKIYYYHGFYRNNSEMKCCLMGHQLCITNCSVDWCVCFPSFLYFACWTRFCACFIPVLMIPNCYNTYVWYHLKFNLVLFYLTILIHVMTGLSDRPAVLTIFVHTTGF